MFKNTFNKDLQKSGIEKWAEDNPETLLCPTCLSNCGQCGASGHHVKAKDLNKPLKINEH